jgi:hypothetical protein
MKYQKIKTRYEGVSGLFTAEGRGTRTAWLNLNIERRVMDAARLKRHMPHKDAITQARAENVLSEIEKEISMMRAELDRDTKKQEAA